MRKNCDPVVFIVIVAGLWLIMSNVSNLLTTKASVDPIEAEVEAEVEPEPIASICACACSDAIAALNSTIYNLNDRIESITSIQISLADDIDRMYDNLID